MDLQDQGTIAMTELLTALGTLGIVLIGIALLLQLISAQDAVGFVGRAVAALVLMILALCILKGLWVREIVPWLSSAFSFLTTLGVWLVVATLGVVLLSTLGRVVFTRFGRYLPLRRDPQNGDGDEIHDSKEEND
jgi:hypothetical protein